MAMSQDCARMETEYEDSCFKDKRFMSRLGIDAKTLRSATKLARLLRDNLADFRRQRTEDEMSEYLHLLMSTRRYIYRCYKKKKAYDQACLLEEGRNEMVERFTTLQYRNTQTEYDVTLESLTRKILGDDDDVNDDEPHDLPGLENEDGSMDTFSASIRNEARYVLRRFDSDAKAIVEEFLQSVYIDDNIHYDEKGLLYWSLARMEGGIHLPGGETLDNAIQSDVHDYRVLIAACKFDRTVFAKVVKLIRFMHFNKLVFNEQGHHTRLVTLKYMFLVDTLRKLSADQLVWSYIRLPSSTSILLQILLSDSLLNTSASRQFKYVKDEMVENLAFALRYLDQVNDLNGRRDIKEITKSYIQIKPGNATDSGLRPTWLGEVATRGHYGRLFFVTPNLSDYKDIVTGRQPAPQTDLLATPPPRGRTIFELSTLDRSKTKLIRGDLDVAPSKRLRIRTDAEFDMTYWKAIFLPIDETLVGRVLDPNETREEEVHKSIINLAQLDGRTKNPYLIYAAHAERLFAKSIPIPNLRRIEVLMEFPKTHSADHSMTLVTEVDWANFEP